MILLYLFIKLKFSFFVNIKNLRCLGFKKVQDHYSDFSSKDAVGFNFRGKDDYFLF